MSSKGKVKIVPSMLGLLCPLVFLDCAARCSPNTAALSQELEFPSTIDLRVKYKLIGTQIWDDFPEMNTGQCRFEPSLFCQYSSLTHVSDGKGKQLESIF